MNKIDQILFKKCVKKHNKKHKRTKSYVTYDKAKRILLLFELKQTENIATIKKIFNELTKDKKEVLIIGFSKTNEKPVEESDFLEIYNNKSVSFFSKPKRDIVNQQKSLEFDLLIDFSSKNILFLSYLSLYTNALMKISSKTELTEIFDFIININEEKEIKAANSEGEKNQILFKKINFYLKNIQTMD